MASGSPARHKAYLNTAPRPKRRFRPEPFPFSLQRTRLLSPVVAFVILRRRSQYRSLLTFKARRMQHGMPLKGPAPTPMIKGRVRHCAWTGCVGLHLPPGQTRVFFIKPMITASLPGRLTGRQFKTSRKRELDSMKSSSGCEPKSVLLSAAHHWMPIPRLTSLVVLNEPSLTFSSETFQVPCSREERLAAVTAVQTRSRYCVMQPSPI